MRLLFFLALFFLLAAPQPVQAQDITTGLAHHWKLDETTGNTVVDSVGGVDGAFYVNGGPPSPDVVTVGGVDGMAVETDGKASSVTIPDGPHFDFGTNSLTISLWAKKRGPSTSYRDCIFCTDAIGNSGSRGIEIFSSANPSDFGNNVYLLGDTDNPRINLTDEQMLSPWNHWKHFTLVIDRSSDIATFYTDGEYSNQTSTTGMGNLNFSGDLNLGVRVNDNDNWFHGLIDDVRIYDRALTPEDVQALYQDPICLAPKGFQGQMLFDADSAVMEYCNGDQWVAMGPARTGWKDVASGWTPTTCGVRNDGTAWCWGEGGDGELGNGTTTVVQPVPVQVQTEIGPGGWSDWTQIDVAKTVACGLRSEGTVWCWGGDYRQQLGCGSCGNQTRPVQVQTDTGPGGWSDWTQIALGGGHHACGLRSDGTAWCWGGGDRGALGDGDTLNNSRPAQVQTDTGPGGWSDWVDISAGQFTTCGLRANGSAWCWGKGSRRLGDGVGTTDQTRPVQVVDAAGTGHWSDWVDIAAGGEVTCGIRENGTAWCWGVSNYGKLGDGGTSGDTSTPVQVQTDTGPGHWNDWEFIFPGEENAAQDTVCGIRADNTLWCWGFGHGDRPGKILADDGSTAWDDWVTAGVGYGTQCGIRRDGTLWCWGQGADGELGNGTTVASEPNPVRVISPPADSTKGTDSGLVGHWKLDGDASDARGMHDAVITGGAVTYDDGPVGNAITLSDDPILLDVDTLDDADVFRDEFTVTGWFNTRDWNLRNIIGNAHQAGAAATGFNITTNSSQQLSFRAKDGTVFQTAAVGGLQADTWYFYAATITETDMSLAVYDEDGTVGTDTSPHSLALNFSPGHEFFGIGRIGNTARDVYGSLDDIRVYNRALSDAEIEELYNLRTPGLSRGLVGHWTFDDIDGTTVPDNSGNGNDGTMVNSPQQINGVTGAALDFDESNPDYIEIGDQSALDITDDISISAWIRGVVNQDTIFSKYNFGAQVGYMLLNVGADYVFRINGDGGPSVRVTGPPYNDGNWHHIVAVKEGNELLRIYMNGREASDQYENQDAGQPIVAPTGITAHIGRRSDNSGYIYNGDLDDVRVYNRALSPSEIEMLYKMGRTAPACADPDGKLGDMVYNGDFDVMQYCNGTNWMAMGPIPGTGGAGCSDPTGGRGDMVYNADHQVMQYCDGDVWRGVGYLQP